VQELDSDSFCDSSSIEGQSEFYPGSESNLSLGRGVSPRAIGDPDYFPGHVLSGLSISLDPNRTSGTKSPAQAVIMTLVIPTSVLVNRTECHPTYCFSFVASKIDEPKSLRIRREPHRLAIRGDLSVGLHDTLCEDLRVIHRVEPERRCPDGMTFLVKVPRKAALTGKSHEEEIIEINQSPIFREVAEEYLRNRGLAAAGISRNQDERHVGSDVKSPGHHSREEIDVLYHPPSPELSEVTVPDSARWWTDKAEEYVEWLRQECELSDGYLKRNLRYLVAFRGNCVRAGVPAPEGPTNLTRDHVRAVKGCGTWGPATLKTTFSVLRGFLRWAANPLSDAKNPVWRLPSGSVDRRKWIDREDMVALYHGALGRLRVRVVLQGFNGLRECEVRRLKVRDLDLSLPRPTLTVHGKGRFGGKYRTIPMDPMTHAVLERWVTGKGPDDLLYPVGHTVADGELADLGKKAGVAARVTGHVLRRSFGRIAYQAGVPLPTIQRIYGHVSIDQSLHYIGVGQEEMSEGFAIFDTHIRAAMDPQRQTVS